MELAKHYATIKLYATIIHCLYKKLARLEFEGKYETDEFEKTIILINKIKKAEKNYYYFLSTLGDEKYILSYNVIAKKDVFGDITGIKKQLNDPSYIFSPTVKTNDIIAMRITSKITDIFRHMHYKEPSSLNLYDTYEPLRDKCFIDVLDSQIEDKDFVNYRKQLIDAKYNYAFIFDKDIEELREYDEELEENNNMDLVIGIGTIMQYKEKFKKLNKKTLLSPKNIKRFILDINYIRACALSIPKENIEIIKDMIIAENTNVTEGINIFLNILDLTIEDKNFFEENDIPYKRKF